MSMKQRLEGMAERMNFRAVELLQAEGAELERDQLKADAEYLRHLAATMKDPDLYIGDRLKAAIILGQGRLYEEAPSDVAKKFMGDEATQEDRELYQNTQKFKSSLAQEELGWLRLIEARNLHYGQVCADWAATKSKDPYPRCEDFGVVATPEGKFLRAVFLWVCEGEVGPRPQRADFGL